MKGRKTAKIRKSDCRKDECVHAGCICVWEWKYYEV